MSKCEDYNAVSRNYDSQRFALGVDETCAMLQFYMKRPVSDLHVLDAGCGTGNYARDMMGYGASHLTLLDASEGMLEKAKAKLSESIKDGKVREVVHATMPPLPFPDASFDVVMFNLVLHHLERNPDGINFPTIEATLMEARRVLNPGGMMSISTSLAYEVSPKIWFYRFDENVGHRHNKLYPTVKQWEGLLERAGFKILSVMVVKTKMPANVYTTLTDPEGPTKKEWRDCNSYWASATPDDLAGIESKIRELKQEGKLEQFVKDNDKSEGYYDVAFIFSKLAG